MPRRTQSLSLMVPLYITVFLAAALLRVWRLSWGLSDGLFFPDEFHWGYYSQMLIRLPFQSLFPNHPIELVYPTLYGYLTGLSALLVRALGLLAPMPPDAAAPDAILDVILVARCVSAAAGVATVAIVAVLGSRLFGRPVGLVAAALLAVAPLHIMQGYYASVDVLLTGAFALTMLAMYSLAERGTALRAALAGGCAALAFATKYVGLAALASVAIVIAGLAVRESAPARAFLLGLAALGGFAIAVLFACPQCVLRPDVLVGALEFLDQAIGDSPRFLNNRLTPTLGWYGHPYVYQAVALLPFSLGWPAACLVFIGIGLAGWQRSRGDLVLLAGIVPYFLAMGASAVTFWRYMLPLLPVLVVLAARAVLALPMARWAKGVTLAGVLVYSFVLAGSQIRRFSYEQQHEVARWIAARGPIAGEGASTRVAVPKKFHGYYRLAEPLRRAGLTYVTLRDGHWFDAEPEVLVLPTWYEIAIRRDRHSEAAAADLDRLKSGAAGYLEAGRWESSYLQESFYTWLDPAFAADLWQGEIGFTVYVRGHRSPPG